MICSTSSPNSEIRYAVSAEAGCTSTTSPLTRKRPRPSSVSLRTYWVSTSLRSSSSRSCSSPTARFTRRFSYSSGRAEAVDARDGRDDHRVAAREERRRGGMPQAIDVVVAGRVLLDVEVGLWDVGLGLVVVVVRDEVLDRVRGEELAELVAELRRQRLVVRDHERGPLQLLDQPRHRRGLAGARRAEQRLEPVARLERRGELCDRLRLVAGRRVGGGDAEIGHLHSLAKPRERLFVPGAGTGASAPKAASSPTPRTLRPS